MYIWQRLSAQFVDCFIDYAKDLISYNPVSKTRLFPVPLESSSEDPLLSLRVETLCPCFPLVISNLQVKL